MLYARRMRLMSVLVRRWGFPVSLLSRFSNEAGRLEVNYKENDGMAKISEYPNAASFAAYCNYIDNEKKRELVIDKAKYEAILSEVVSRDIPDDRLPAFQLVEKWVKIMVSDAESISPRDDWEPEVPQFHGSIEELARWWAENYDILLDTETSDLFFITCFPGYDLPKDE